MAHLSALAAVPSALTFTVEQILLAAQGWLGLKSEEYLLFERFVRASGTKSRRYIFPLEKILGLGGQAERARLFLEQAQQLVEVASSQALVEAKIQAQQIDTIIFVSCTCPTIPSLDATLVQSLGFSPTVIRLPIYQQGCAGGVVGLARAREFASAGKRVLLVNAELCSLLFRAYELTSVHLLGCTLFADGVTAAIVEPGNSGLYLSAAQSYLLPESAHLMGYDIQDDGAHLLLDRGLPLLLEEHAKRIVSEFLAREHCSVDDIRWWLIHPGGIRILEGLKRLFSLEEEQFRWSWEVLSEIGNMSSATVLFVLARFLDSKVIEKGDRVLMLGIGPGLTIELLLFHYVG